MTTPSVASSESGARTVWPEAGTNIAQRAEATEPISSSPPMEPVVNVPAVVGDMTPGATEGRRRITGPSVRTMAVAGLAALALVLALINLTSSKTNNNAALPPSITTTSTPTTSTPTTAPLLVIPTTPPVVAAAGGSNSSSNPATTKTTSASAATTTAAVPVCSASDLAFTTTTDKVSYKPNSQDVVTVTTTMTVLHTCSFTPKRTGAYNCPVAIVITNSSGNAVYPNSIDTYECSNLQSGTFNTGSKQQVFEKWGQTDDSSGAATQVPDGTYTTTASWSWSSGTASPAASFDISS